LQNFIHVKSQPTPWHKRRLRMQAFVFFLLWCDAAALGDWWPTFRDISSSRVECSVDIQVVEAWFCRLWTWVSMFLRNVGLNQGIYAVSKLRRQSCEKFLLWRSETPFGKLCLMPASKMLKPSVVRCDHDA
jgi:hypothetical protein